MPFHTKKIKESRNIGPKIIVKSFRLERVCLS